MADETVTFAVPPGAQVLTIAAVPPPPGSLHLEFGGAIEFFYPDGSSALRLEPGGAVSINGEQVDNNHAAYQALRQWLARVGVG